MREIFKNMPSNMHQYANYAHKKYKICMHENRTNFTKISNFTQNSNFIMFKPHVLLIKVIMSYKNYFVPNFPQINPIHKYFRSTSLNLHRIYYNDVFTE